MKTLRKTILATAISATLFSGHTYSDSFTEALKDGKASLGFRYRFEDVSQDPSAEATANTLQTRLNYTSGAYKGFSLFVEMDHVVELGNVDYNTGPGGETFPGAATIADPEGTDLNQAYFQYKSGGSLVKLGRQRILLDDQRFVGGVGWRQNEQTYDAISYTNTSVDGLKLFGAYVNNVNRIFGDDRAPAGDNSNESVLLNANYKVSDSLTVVGYGYLIDNEDLLHYSSDTFGVRVTGKAGDFAYTAGYATQKDAGDSPLDYSADFIELEGSFKIKPVKVTLGYQVLGADGANGQFITPLATLHKFQGWNDKFLGGGTGNIAGGIEDLYGSVGGKIGKVTASVVYHTYESDDSSVGAGDLGSEIGIVLKGKAGPVGLLFKASDYSADDFATDTQKVWLMATYKL